MNKIDFNKKSDEIRSVILHKVKDFNRIYRSGPDLYFYKRVLFLNRQAKSLHDFISSDYNLEIIYATLVAWDMNSRGAKMKYFNEFKENIVSLEKSFREIWGQKIENIKDSGSFLSFIGDIYEKLHVMKGKDRFVSNSKLLHFIFPNLLMPMDRSNTLVYFYKHTNESKEKYLDLIKWSYDMAMIDGIRWSGFFDDGWNSTIPKILDNAVIIKNDISVKKMPI